MVMSRRNFIATTGVTTAGLAFGLGTSTTIAGPKLSGGDQWLTALGTSLAHEHDYAPRIEGHLPEGLTGRLYRNGPGLFERDGYRKQHLLDGDGMIQCFDFPEAGVRYRNKFVRTEKYLEEEAAGALIYPTWTTRAPGGVLSNIGCGMKSQAGVTTLMRDGKLLALDEVAPVYALDPDSLETTGSFEFPDGITMDGCKAHTKLDSRTGDWIVVATEYGRSLTLRYLIIGKDGNLKREGRYTSPRMTYLHDFFATEKHLIFVLHPVSFSPFAMLAGLKTFTDSLSWEPADGNIVMVVDKAGGEPVLLDAPSAFMWHALNAYEQAGEIIADFIGYDVPDHFIGGNPIFKSVMKGEAGEGKYPGTLRRYVIDLQKGQLREEIIDTGHQEFPMIDLRVTSQRHQYGYMAIGGVGEWTLDGVARTDYKSGHRAAFRFGPQHFVGEPVFAPSGTAEGEGWLLAQVQNGTSGKNYLAVFVAGTIEQGPIAKVHLDHHVPLSFHGYWAA